MNSDIFKERCRKIRVVVTDVDGVLTDGGMYYGDDGVELKRFNVRDGAGIALLQAAGLKTGLLTGEISPLIERRAAKIGADFLWTGIKDKLSCLQDFADKTGITLEAIAYIGDEINDCQLPGRTGLFFTVPDGNRLIQEKADWILETPGGNGVLREVALLILETQGTLQEAMRCYTLNHCNETKK